MVGHESLADGLDDRNAAGHRCFVEDGHTFFRGELENFRAMLGKESLVAGDNDLSAADGLEDKFTRFVDAAHQFDDHFDRRIVEQITPASRQKGGRDGHGAFLGRIFDRDLAHHKVTTRPLTEQRPVFFQIEENSGAHRAKPG